MDQMTPMLQNMGGGIVFPDEMANLLIDYSNEEIGQLYWMTVEYQYGNTVPEFNDRGLLTLFRLMTGYLDTIEKGDTDDAKKEGCTKL